MKGERWIACLEGALLGFALSIGCVGCIVTGLSMSVDWRSTAWFLAVASVIGAVCFSMKLSLLPGGMLGLLALYYWGKGLSASIGALLRHVSIIYDSAYNIGIFPAAAGDPQLALWLIGLLVSLAVGWTVCRRKSGLWALTAVALSVACCFVVTDTLPATWGVGVLLWGSCLLLICQNTRRRSERAGNRLAALAAIPAGLCVALLLTLVPQETYRGQERAELLQMYVQNWVRGLQGAGGKTYPGFVELRTVGPQVLPKTPVMQVTSQGKSGTVYLRARAYENYGGNSWVDADDAFYEDLYWPGDQRLGTAYTLEIKTAAVHDVLYWPYYASSSQMQDRFGNWSDKTSYSYQVQDLKNWSAEPIADYEIFPADLPAQIRYWAKDYVQPLLGENPAETAENIRLHVRNSATYSLTTPRMPENQLDFVIWFLEESDTGYCVHFASAAVVLLRAAGIPARYVTGYMTTVRDGQTVTVYENQAHAWAEYWEPGTGWQILEATPGVSVTQSQTGNNPTPGQNLPRPTQPVTPQTQPQQQGKKPARGNWWILWLCLPVLAAPVVQWRIRRYLRRRKCEKGSTNQRAVACWREVTLLARLLNERPDKALFMLAQKARYSQHTLTEEELVPFGTYIADARQRLSRQPFRKRMVYALIWAAI